MRTAEHLGARPRLFAGWVSVASAVLIYLVTKYLDPSNALVYTIVGSLIISSVAAKIAGQKLGENAVAEQMCRLRLEKPTMNLNVARGALSLACLTIGANIAFGNITSGMSGGELNVDHLTVYSGLADALLLKGKRVAIVDDVISTGESLLAIERLVEKAGGDIVARAAILAEGDAAKRDDILFLEPLPLFPLD